MASFQSEALKGPLELAMRLWRAVLVTINSAVDAVPPYRKIEGRLDAKEASHDGSYYLAVDTEIVEVDRLTFDTLMVGEALRIRCTRSMKAINIDRLIP